MGCCAHRLRPSVWFLYPQHKCVSWPESVQVAAEPQMASLLSGFIYSSEGQHST
jgi:hypothetical protein